MFFFRRKTIFHVEEALPDPEELKLRFRRRVLLLTLTGCLATLSVPVARDLREDLKAREGARKFAETLLESRSLASKGRHPVSLALEGDSRTWRRSLHRPGESCSSAAAAIDQTWPTPTDWKLQVQTAGGTAVSGRTICLHPTEGLYLDQTPLENGRLLVSALRSGDSPDREAAFLLVSQFGAEIQMAIQ